MTAAQTQLYFFEWGNARKWYLAHGLDPKQADNKRHTLHRQALGTDKSSKDFTNADLDKVLAAFRGVSRPDDFNAQMDIQEQPERRLGKMQAEAWGIVRKVGWVMKASDPQFAAENYLNKLARSVTGKSDVRFEEIGERETGRVLGILKHRLGAKPEAVAVVKADDENPF